MREFKEYCIGGPRHMVRADKKYSAVLFVAKEFGRLNIAEAKRISLSEYPNLDEVPPTGADYEVSVYLKRDLGFLGEKITVWVYEGLSKEEANEYMLDLMLGHMEK